MLENKITFPCTLGELIDPPMVGAGKASLELAPRPETVDSYILTYLSAKALEITISKLGAGESIFWVWGPPDTGKTHFLNYLIATQLRAETWDIKGRTLVIGGEINKIQTDSELPALTLHLIGRALGVNKKELHSWKEVGLIQGIRISLAEAGRAGIGSLFLVYDLGDSEPTYAIDFLNDVYPLISTVKRPRVAVFVASRGCPPPGATGLRIEPTGEHELIELAVMRSRRLKQDAPAILGMLDTGYSDPTRFKTFPFTSQSLNVLKKLRAPDRGVGFLCELLQDLLFGSGNNSIQGLSRLLMPVDLLTSKLIRKRFEALLGENGCEALKLGYASVRELPVKFQPLAHQVVDALALAYLVEDELETGRLRDYVPEWDEKLAASLELILEHFERKTNGIISHRDSLLRFNPRVPKSEIVASYNAALPVLQQIDPTLVEAKDENEFTSSVKKLEHCASQTIAIIRAVNESLCTLDANWRAKELSSYARQLDYLVGVLSRGANALIEVCGHSDSRKELEEALTALSFVRQVTAIAPQVLKMRSYLTETGLLETELEHCTGIEPEKSVASLQVQARLLDTELTLKVVSSGKVAYDALEARFSKFRAEYIQVYRAYHRQWAKSLQEFSRRLGKIRQQLTALQLLDSLEVLGSPQAETLKTELDALTADLVECDEEKLDNLDRYPRCSTCGYTLGTGLPDTEKLEIRVLEALNTKLKRLSEEVIRKLMKTYGRRARVEGFLRIIQAGQADTLVKLLDEELVEYLREVLSEHPEPAIALPLPNKVFGSVKSRAQGHTSAVGRGPVSKSSRARGR